MTLNSYTRGAEGARRKGIIDRKHRAIDERARRDRDTKLDDDALRRRRRRGANRVGGTRPRSTGRGGVGARRTPRRRSRRARRTDRRATRRRSSRRRGRGPRLGRRWCRRRRRRRRRRGRRRRRVAAFARARASAQPVLTGGISGFGRHSRLLSAALMSPVSMNEQPSVASHEFWSSIIEHSSSHRFTSLLFALTNACKSANVCGHVSKPMANDSACAMQTAAFESSSLHSQGIMPLHESSSVIA